MKQTFSKTLVGCAAAVMVTGALLTPVMGANASSPWQTADTDFIGRSRAEEIALDPVSYTHLAAPARHWGEAGPGHCRLPLSLIHIY